MLSRSWLPRLLCIGRDHWDDHRWPGWRWCRMTSTPMGCHGPMQSTWPRTDHSGGCWRLVVVQAGYDDDDDDDDIINLMWKKRRFSIQMNNVLFQSLEVLSNRINHVLPWKSSCINGLRPVQPDRPLQQWLQQMIAGSDREKILHTASCYRDCLYTKWVG